MWSEDDMDELRANALKTCQEFLGGAWKNLKYENFQFSKVSGGLSNRLYKCSLSKIANGEASLENSGDDGNCPREVLLRIYGQMKDREAEGFLESVVQDAVVYTQLAEKQLGPKLYGVFSDGRLEEFVPSIILSSDNMRNMSFHSARELARIHSLRVPIRKEPDTFFHHCESWMQFIEKNIDLDRRELRPSAKHIISSKTLWQEIEWLHALVKGKSYPVAFCHNDLQGGNILLRQDSKGENKIFFIDFEFSYYNYRAFDIANHFNEWCFDYNTEHEPYFECDLKKFPTKQEQESFIDVYLDQLETDDHISCEKSKEKKKSELLKEVEVFIMFSHLYWTIWSFKMALVSKGQYSFGFTAHGETRFHLHGVFKKAYLARIQNKNV